MSGKEFSENWIWEGWGISAWNFNILNQKHWGPSPNYITAGSEIILVMSDQEVLQSRSVSTTFMRTDSSVRDINSWYQACRFPRFIISIFGTDWGNILNQGWECSGFFPELRFSLSKVAKKLNPFHDSIEDVKDSYLSSWVGRPSGFQEGLPTITCSLQT
jgi:hypothetical protein